MVGYISSKKRAIIQNIRDGRLISNIIQKINGSFRTAFSEKSRVVPFDKELEFTLNKQIPVVYNFRDDEYPSIKPIVFSKKYMEKLIARAKNNEIVYDRAADPYLFKAFEKYNQNIKGKEGIDMGSVSGWYSAITVAYGAKTSFILEYNKIISGHEQVIPLQYPEFDAAPRQFDFGTSISSFEHDGLGRYGDPINPNGDIMAMQRMKQILKPGALLFLVVPIGQDTLVWNSHRVYGKLRFSKLIEGWALIEAIGFKYEDFDTPSANFKQPVFVLQNEQ